MTGTPTQGSGVSKRLFVNVGVNFFGQAFLLLLNIITAPYIVNRLGADLFGIIALVQTFAGFAGVTSLGIGRALTKYVSELHWRGATNQINTLFRTAWATCIVAGLLSVVLVVAFRTKLATLFFRGNPEIGFDLVNFAIYAAAFGLLLSILLEAAVAIPVAAQRFQTRNAIDVSIGLIRVLGTVLLLMVGYSIRSVLIINLVASLLGLTSFLIFSRRIVPELSFSPLFDRYAFRKLLGFSTPLMLSAVSAMIVQRIDRFMLAYYLPISAVTFYTLPYSLCEKLTMAVTNVTSVVLPFASELHAMQAHEKVHEVYLRASKMLVLVILPVVMVLMTIPGQILEFWLGAEYATQGAATLSLLAIATFLNAASGVATVTLLGIGQPWIPSAFAFITSIINLTGDFTLIPLYGIKGAAWAFLLSQLMVVPFVYVANKLIKLSSMRFVHETILAALACAAAQALFLFETEIYISGLTSLLAVSGASLVLFGLLSLFIAVTKQERRAVFSAAASGLAVLRRQLQMLRRKIS